MTTSDYISLLGVAAAIVVPLIAYIRARTAAVAKTLDVRTKELATEVERVRTTDLKHLSERLNAQAGDIRRTEDKIDGHVTSHAEGRIHGG